MNDPGTAADFGRLVQVGAIGVVALGLLTLVVALVKQVKRPRNCAGVRCTRPFCYRAGQGGRPAAKRANLTTSDVSTAKSSRGLPTKISGRRANDETR